MQADRERLIRLLGLWENVAALKLPSQLPALPSRARTRDSIEREALEKRLDLRAARIEIDAVARELRLTSWSRFLDVLSISGSLGDSRSRASGEVAPAPNGQTGGVAPGRAVDFERSRVSGLSVEVQIPLDLGESRIRGARETYLRSVHKLTELSVNVRSEAREAYQRYRGGFDYSRHYQMQVLPLRQIIAEEGQLHYNGMIIDVFELLADARARVAANATAIEARRDFWIANSDLQFVTIGGAPGAGASDAPAVASAGAAAAD